MGYNYPSVNYPSFTVELPTSNALYFYIIPSISLVLVSCFVVQICNVPAVPKKVNFVTNYEICLTCSRELKSIEFF